MATNKEPADHSKDVHEIINRIYYAIDALEQYNNALHKLEKNFLSESAVQLITYGDVRDTIVRLMQTKEYLENAMNQYEKFMELDASAQELLR